MRRKLSIILVSGAMALAGCSQPAETPYSAGQPGPAPAAEKPEGTPAGPKGPLVIGPAAPTRRSQLSVSGDRALLDGAQISWTLNGIAVPEASGRAFASEGLRKGDVVQVVLRKGDREERSNEAIIENTPPVIEQAKLDPPVAAVGTALTVNAVIKDVDEEDITKAGYRWFVNGEFRDETDAFRTEELKRDDEISVEVTPSDGTDTGQSVRLKTRLVNSPPVVDEGTAQFDNFVYTYQIRAKDVDEDALTYALISAPEGMTVDAATGLISWKLEPTEKRVTRVEFSVSDGKGGRTSYGFDVTTGVVLKP